MTEETPEALDEPGIADDVPPVADEPAPDAPADVPDDPAPDEDAEPSPADPPAEAKALAAARREAAGYRTKLRAAETEVESLRAEVETHRRRQIDGVVTGTTGELHDPADLWSFSGLSTADLFGDDGALDEVRLTSALGELREARPYLFKHPAQTGPRDGGARGPQPQAPSFGAALRRAAGG